MTSSKWLTCDACFAETPQGWMVPTGKTDAETGLPIVQMFCNDCFDRREAHGRSSRP